MVYHMLNNVPREVFFVNALSSGNFENVKRFLGKMWEYISGVPNVVEEKKKKKTRRLPVIQRSTRRTGQGSFRLNGKLAGHGQSMITIRE